MTDELAREALERAQFLEATSELGENEANVLAFSELGYSCSGIAKHVGCAQTTAEAVLERIAARYGEQAIWPKKADERGKTKLSEVERGRYLDMPTCQREWWVDIVRRHPREAPEWAVEEFGVAGDEEEDDGDDEENGGITLEGWQ